MMRIAPTVALVGAPRIYDASVAPAATAVAVSNTSTQNLNVNVTATGMTVGRPAHLLVDAVETAYVAVSARM
jgi:hypothetical protein